MPQGRHGDRAGDAYDLVHAAAQAHVPALPGQGLPAAGDQPVHRVRGRGTGGAGLQDELRRQRALSSGHGGGASGLRRGGPQGGRGHGSRAQLHRAGRQRGVHRQRRGPRDGHDGRHRAPRRAAGELPRRGRRRQPGEDRERVPHRAEGPARRRDPREHLRGDQPMRLDRAGSGAGYARPGDRRPRHRATGRHERGRGAPDPPRERPRPDPGGRPGRRGGQGRGGGGAAGGGAA